MLEPHKVASARRGASIVIVLALAMMFTTIVLFATRSALVVWLLGAEGLALITVALLIRADLRTRQRHTVK